MRAWVVLSVGVELLLQELVGHEVNGLEGDVHSELGGVAAVESSSPFIVPHSPHTVRHTLVRRVVHLHPLFDHLEQMVAASNSSQDPGMEVKRREKK